MNVGPDLLEEFLTQLQYVYRITNQKQFKTAQDGSKDYIKP
jgi:hypothetical protein